VLIELLANGDHSPGDILHVESEIVEITPFAFPSRIKASLQGCVAKNSKEEDGLRLA